MNMEKRYLPGKGVLPEKAKNGRRRGTAGWLLATILPMLFLAHFWNLWAADVWPFFEQNLRHTSRSPYGTGHNSGIKKWEFVTGSFIFSSPAIGSDGTIYVGSYDKKLYALNPDGTKKWEFLTGSQIYSSPAIGSDGTVYVGSGDKKVYAINPDGTKKWEFLTGKNVQASPIIGSDGTVYVGSHDFKLYALNPDGTKKWEFATGNSIVSSPAIGSDGTIYVGSHDYKLYAINPDGTKKWEFATGNSIYSSCALGSDGTIYVGSYDKKIYAINPDGTKKWEFLMGNATSSSPAIGSDGTVYVGSNFNRLYALNPDGTKKWEFLTGNYIYSSPAIGSDGTLYVGSNDKKLYAINPDGTKKWEFLTGNSLYSSPAIGSDGTVYIGSLDNKLYAIGSFTITATSGTGGSLSPSGSVYVTPGTSQSFTITPSAGYHIAGVLVDGSSAGTGSSYTFTNVTANHTVSASFAINVYTLAYTAGANGTLTGTASQSVSHGGSGTPVTAVANGGYHFVQWSDGSTSNPRTDTNVTGPVNVTATFAIDTYTITATTGSGGSITPVGSVSVNHGASQSFTITPSSGYHIVDVLVEGSSVGAVSSYTFTNVTANHTISASFAINTYTLGYTAGANGTLTGTASQSVNHGGNGTPVTAVANEGYHFVQWSDGSTANPRTDTNVTGPISVTASFAINTYTITATAAPGGRITPEGRVSVDHGTNQSFSVYPDIGYYIADIVVDGASKGAFDSYAFTDVTADHRVRALFTAYALKAKIANPREGETLSGDVEVTGEVSGDCAFSRVTLTADGTPLEGPLPERTSRRILSGSLSVDLTDALWLSLDGGKRLRKRTAAGEAPVLNPDLPVESATADPSGALHLVLCEPVTLACGLTTSWVRVDNTGDSLTGINASPVSAPRFDSTGRAYFLDRSGSLMRLEADLAETLVDGADLPKGLRVGRFLVLSAQEVVYTLEEAEGLRSILIWRSRQGSAPYVPPRGSSLEEALLQSGATLLATTPGGELLTQEAGRLELDSGESSLEFSNQGIRFSCGSADGEGFLLGGRSGDGKAGVWRMDRQGRLTLAAELEQAPLGLALVPPAASQPRPSANTYRWLWKTRDLPNGPHTLTMTVEGEVSGSDQVTVNTLNVPMGLTLTRLEDRGWLIRKEFVRVALTLNGGQGEADRLLLYRRPDQGKEILVKEFAASQCVGGTLRYDDLTIARGEHGVYRAEALSKSGQVIGIAPEARY